MLKRIPVPPGVNKSNTSYSRRGRYTGADKVRFVGGLPEKLGGWSQLLSTQFAGICRGMHAWTDNNDAKRLAFGTHKKLYYYYAGALTDITPVRDSGTLGTDPFTTTSGSAVVAVADTAHGLADGDYVTFGGSDAVGGITPDGTYTVTQVTGSNTYTITHSSNASSSATGGGSSVTYSYEISVGREDTISASGYGVGTYGTDTWGTARTSSVLLHARTWSLDSHGQDLLACPRGGSIYKWDPDVGSVAAVLSNAPTSNTAMVVAEDQHVFAFGYGGVKRKAGWSDQDDNTIWTAAATNTAGSRTVADGNEFVGGIKYSDRVVLGWTDTALFSFTYTGDDYTFESRKRGSGMGLYGPLAATEMYGVVYWMSDQDFFGYDGRPYKLPSEDIRDFVYADINADQRAKSLAVPNKKFSEIIFFYCSSGATEIDRYVIFNTIDKSWVNGTMARTSWEDSGVYSLPIAAGSDGYLYSHETGHDDDGSAMDASIELAPTIELADGEYALDVLAVVPDFDDLIGDLTFTLFTAMYPMQTRTEEPAVTLNANSEREDLRASGRAFGYKIRSNESGGHFRLGVIRLDVERAGKGR